MEHLALPTRNRREIRTGSVGRATAAIVGHKAATDPKILISVKRKAAPKAVVRKAHGLTTVALLDLRGQPG